MITTLIIFILAYAGIAFGRIPGLTINRTGIALVGGIAMIACGTLSTAQAADSVDVPTLLLLFGLMIVSTQLNLNGFHTIVATRLTRFAAKPRTFLLALIFVAGALSALLVNDIVCLAFTPIVISALKRGRLNPAPYLIALACAANIGSAATLIGNPQNMFIGQLASLSFCGYFLKAAPIAAAGLLITWLFVMAIYRGKLSAPEAPPAEEDFAAEKSKISWQLWKGLLVMFAILVAFCFPLPREIVALAGAAILLCSRRMDMRELLRGVNWPMLLLFCGLFVLIGGFETIPLHIEKLELENPLRLLGATTLLSNTLSNVPAVMLLRSFVPAAETELWEFIALVSTFAGNLITVGSVANLIVIEEAKERGVEISFLEHFRTGLPVTVVTLALALLLLIR